MASPAGISDQKIEARKPRLDLAKADEFRSSLGCFSAVSSFKPALKTPLSTSSGDAALPGSRIDSGPLLAKPLAARLCWARGGKPGAGNGGKSCSVIKYAGHSSDAAAAEAPSHTRNSVKSTIRVVAERRSMVGAVNAKPEHRKTACIEFQTSYHGKRINTMQNPVAIDDSMGAPDVVVHKVRSAKSKDVIKRH